MIQKIVVQSSYLEKGLLEEKCLPVCSSGARGWWKYFAQTLSSQSPQIMQEMSCSAEEVTRHTFCWGGEWYSLCVPFPFICLDLIHPNGIGFIMPTSSSLANCRQLVLQVCGSGSSSLQLNGRDQPKILIFLFPSIQCLVWSHDLPCSSSQALSWTSGSYAGALSLGTKNGSFFWGHSIFSSPGYFTSCSLFFIYLFFTLIGGPPLSSPINTWRLILMHECLALAWVVSSQLC